MTKRLLLALTLVFGVFIMAPKASKADTDPENTLFLDLTYGRVVIEMRPDLAPNHVKRIKELVRKGFYDGAPFHRVIEGFMAQTGDPTGTGMGGSGQKLKAEFSNEAHRRGVVSMARPGDVNGADSQFFIVLADSTYLDGQYTVWGRVVKGMEFVDQIKKGNKQNNGTVSDPDKIIKLQVAADVKANADSDKAADDKDKADDSKDKASDASDAPDAAKEKPAKGKKKAAGSKDN